MKALIYVYPGEDVTLPPEIMEAAGIEPGDAVLLSVTGLSSVGIRVLPLPPLSEAMGKDFALDEALVPKPDNGSAGLEADRDTAGTDRPIDFDALPILTVAQLRERFPIHGPIAWEADREAWSDAAAKDVFGERPDGIPS